ncbi:unnamed protein product, partial [Allacma fusca]
FNYKR